MEPTMEEMKFIGSFRIFSQSFKTIFKWKKIFAQITLTLILPLAIVFILHMEISNRLFYKIEKNPYLLFTGAFDSYRSYYFTGATATSTATATVTNFDWLNYFLFKSTSIATVTALSLLSTATVAYTTASIYTGRDVTFRKSMKIVPNVWKRLTVTLLGMFLTLFTYSLLTSVAVFISNAIRILQFFTFLAISILYIFGFLYITIIYQLASVISVLENTSGIKSMIKATDLMKSKTKTALNVSSFSYLILASVVFVYMAFVMYDSAVLLPVWRWMIGIVCLILLVITFLVIMVNESVLYLVCKSYHGEAIDVVGLSTYLSAYLGDSRPVFRTGEVIQLGTPHNQPV